VAEWQAASADAHYIWFWFAGIGMISAFALIAYSKFAKSGD